MNTIQQLMMILNSATDKPSDTLIAYFNVSDLKKHLWKIHGISSHLKLMHEFWHVLVTSLLQTFLNKYILIRMV